jgi:predicted ATPase/Tfp pilus assembly protein PilF
MAVPQCVRIASAGHGDQILISNATRELVVGFADDISFLDLGAHTMKDLVRPERLFQVVGDGLPERFPPPATLDARRHNLPAPLTSLVGRDDDAAAVSALFNDGTRLVTLSGPGGVGKTRLAMRIGTDLVERYPDGVWFVALASVRDPRLVLRAIAGELHITEEPGRDLATQVSSALRSRRTLLILDNFEQVTAAAADVAGLLEGCPHVDVLVTSREVLRIRGEREHTVAPLPMPKLLDLPPADMMSMYDAVALFVERARAIDPAFELTTANAAAIAEICTRLDGLPLALELAAARVKLLPPEAMLSRLSNRLGLLTGGARDLPERHRTLREAIAWSYDLLGADEQRTLRGLSVFTGGCTLEAAEHVAGADALDLVASLVDKSLLRPSGDRFEMLDTIREFALEQLGEAPEAEAVRTAHASWYADLASKAADELTRSDQGVWLRRLDDEHDNMRSTLWTLLEGGRTAAAADLASDLATYWYVRGHLSEGRRWLDAILDAETEPTTARAKALAARANFALSQSDYDEALAAFTEHLDLVRVLGEQGAEAATLNALGRIARDRGDLAGASARFEECVRLCEQIADRHMLCRGTANLATVHRIRGELDVAEGLTSDALDLARAIDDPGAICDCLTGLATVVRLQGDLGRARELYEQALFIARDRGTKPGVMRIVNSLGHVVLRSGDVSGARALYGEGMALAQDIGDRRAQSAFLNGLAKATQAAGDLDAARDLFEEALGLKRTIGDRIGEALSLHSLGVLSAQAGDAEQASVLLGESLAIRRDVGIQDQAAETLLELGRLALRRGERAEALHRFTEARDTRAGLRQDVTEIDALIAEASGPEPVSAE